MSWYAATFAPRDRADPDSSQFMFTAFLHRRASIISLANVWITSFLGNLAGMLFFMAIVTGCRSFRIHCMLEGLLIDTCRWWCL